MSGSLTDSVARLYRAGSEHSKDAAKLRQAVDDLLIWMLINVPLGVELPCQCRLYPSKEFVRMHPDCVHKKFGMTIKGDHTREQLLEFSKLIADGFLEKLAEFLEKETIQFRQASGEVSKFLIGER